MDWSDQARRHMWESHGVTTDEANEAIEDVEAIWFEPDPASRSGRTSRVVGYSRTRRQILSVILLSEGDELEGLNAWPANATYRRIYREGAEHDGA